ncbi:MAG: phosphoadenylyl-sulfate reductase [Thermoanaerobaculia bacterium]
MLRVDATAPEPTAQGALLFVAEHYATRTVFTTGFGLEGCVLVSMIATGSLPIDIVTLDTGLLFPETYALWEELQQRYGVEIRGVKPVQNVAEQGLAHGDGLWARDPDLCCALRKVQPLRQTLARYDAWVTAIRRDQTPQRARARAIETDAQFGLVKVNPLVAWNHEEVSAYAREHRVPFSPLHEQGFPSVGCVPCTSPVSAGEAPRVGRWRGLEKTECGLHTPVSDLPFR